MRISPRHCRRPDQVHSRGAATAPTFVGQNKAAANAIRTTMMESIGTNNVYDLNRFHLEVKAPSMFHCKKR